MEITELGIGFASGVGSSFTAGILLTRFRSKTLVRKITWYLLQRDASKEIRKILATRQPGKNVPPDDPLDLVRAEWALSLYDLRKRESGALQRTLECLLHIAPILPEEDRAVAAEAIRLRTATNEFRELDSDFARTLEALTGGLMC